MYVHDCIYIYMYMYMCMMLYIHTCTSSYCTMHKYCKTLFLVLILCTYNIVHDCFSPLCLRQLSRFRSGALATVAGGSLDPSDLSQRLSSLPPEAESEGDSAPLFGGGTCRSFTCIHIV